MKKIREKKIVYEKIKFALSKIENNSTSWLEDDLLNCIDEYFKAIKIVNRFKNKKKLKELQDEINNMKDKINSYAKSGQVVRRPYFWNPDREYETTYEVDLKELAKKYKKKLKI